MLADPPISSRSPSPTHSNLYPDVELGREDIPRLDEDQVWIKRHPSSKQPSGLLATPAASSTRCNNVGSEPQSALPPFFPFRTREDFLQAEIFSDKGADNDHINRQLALSSSPGSKITMRNAKEYHETLARASHLWGEVGKQSIPLSLLAELHP